FGEAEQRQFADVEPGFETLCLHALAADADEAGVRVALAQRGDQVVAELVAGVFAGEEGDEGGFGWRGAAHAGECNALPVNYGRATLCRIPAPRARART